MHVSKLIVIIMAIIFGLPCIAGVDSGTIEVDGAKRSYQVFVPDGVGRDPRFALVLDFHGSGSNPEAQSRYSNLRQVASEQRFIVVHPAGVYVRAVNSGASWNVDLDPQGVDDVKFTRVLIDSLRRRYSIDPSRIFATGFSGGARMSSRLACDMSDVFAAVAPVGGVRFPDKCSPSSPVAVLAIHAEDDTVNHFEHRADSPAYWPMGVRDAIARWTRQNECKLTPRSHQINTEVTRFTFEDCAPGGDVVLLTSKRGGHMWPGSPTLKPQDAQQFGGLAATEEIWRFFSEHPKRARASAHN